MRSGTPLLNIISIFGDSPESSNWLMQATPVHDHLKPRDYEQSKPTAGAFIQVLPETLLYEAMKEGTSTEIRSYRLRFGWGVLARIRQVPVRALDSEDINCISIIQDWMIQIVLAAAVELP